MEVTEIVVDIAKPIIPVGETREDDRRLTNLKERIDLINELLIDIDATATGVNRVEHSIHIAGMLAERFLNSLKK